MNKELYSVKKVINVLTIGMDSRKQSIFQMAFKRHASHNYRLIEDISTATPDLAIVDMDCMDSQRLWENFRSNHPDLPAIMTSISSIPDGAVPVLAKPIQVEKLFSLLQQVLSNTVSANAQKLIRTGAAETRSPQLSTVATIANKPLSIQTTTEDSKCSPIPVALLNQLPENIERFNPNEGLLGLLISIHRNNIPSMVSISNQNRLIILPEENRVLILCSMDILRDSIQASNNRIISRPLTTLEQSGHSDAPTQTLSAILWQVALWTSRGRLLNNIDITAQLRIRYWPNLTRLAPVPNGIRIAAFLVRSPANIRIIVHMLNIPPADIFDFIAASYSIGILDVPQHESDSNIATRPTEKKIRSEKRDRGGLLSRLLSKIIDL
ncbi:conserved hypothetical protein [Gammaproteobacteria bacterium]